MGECTKIIDEELYSIIDQKLTALMYEMQGAGWASENVTLAIDMALRKKCVNLAPAFQAARDELPKDFVSDGNEG